MTRKILSNCRPFIDRVLTHRTSAGMGGVGDRILVRLLEVDWVLSHSWASVWGFSGMWKIMVQLGGFIG